MPGILITIAGLFGISPLRLIIYAACIVAVVTGALVIRQHYIDLGWSKHKAAIERQDNIAIDAGKKVEQRVQQCSKETGFWDVVSQGCKLQEGEAK